MTLVTPMTMPSSVRPLRTLWARSVSHATFKFSPNSDLVMVAYRAAYSDRSASTGSSIAARRAG